MSIGQSVPCSWWLLLLMTLHWSEYKHRQSELEIGLSITVTSVAISKRKMEMVGGILNGGTVLEIAKAMFEFESLLCYIHYAQIVWDRNPLNSPDII